MASVTRGKDEKAAGADKDLGPGEEDAVKAPVPAVAKAAADDRRKDDKVAKRAGNYFTVYKKGQGYWTRMGTVIGAGVLGLMLAYTIFDKVSASTSRKVGAEVAVGFLAVFCAVAWYFINKPSNVDFLIQTDSEMKKVNWTSRKELIGSTQIVIIFMFIIALFLFTVDEAWGWLMYVCRVLRDPPFGS